jgi:hypothetical protein
MRIATFGCSWTHGVGAIDKHFNWPLALSKLRPEWYIDNYALGGSSLSFQLYCYNKAIKHNDYDKVIFQFTNPGRLTFFPEDHEVFDGHINFTKNYKMFDISDGFYRNINCITMGHTSLPKNNSFWTSKEKYNLMKAYYSTMPKEIYRAEYRAMVEYAEKRSSLCFFHNEDVLKLNRYPVINQEVINNGSKDMLDSFIADEGEHYNKAGCEWIANWVLEKI